MFTSIFNDVLGPVMRGPSSSHTAGSYHIGLTARQLLGKEPKRVSVSFDMNGSYAKTYSQQGVDLAFITGIMGWKQTDEIFLRAISAAADKGVQVNFETTLIQQADHPNFVIIELLDLDNHSLKIAAKSIGGGTFNLVKVDGFDVLIDGKTFETLLTFQAHKKPDTIQAVEKYYPDAWIRNQVTTANITTLQLSSATPAPENLQQLLPQILEIRQCRPVYYTQKNAAQFNSATEITDRAENTGQSLGQIMLEYEKNILGISKQEAVEEMLARYAIMKRSVLDGLKNDTVDMLLLEPTAGTIMENVQHNRVAIGGLHARAGAAALAAMHTCNSRGLVCAAPTGGAAGTLPGVITTLEDEYQLSDTQIALMLFAAGGIGLILAIRGTFAAEVAGCQVEIGAAGAMASAAVVEFSGGSALQACDAAAISFQNTMGLVCDLVQGMCELPCHTRNAIAASSAFTNADMILGGYVNHIHLDQTIDAVYSSGLLLPPELRCTALGGIALAPAAINLRRKR